MGSSNLSILKRRMKSIKNTMKINKAMSVIANSKIQRCRARSYTNEEYFRELQKVMSYVFSMLDTDNKFTKKNKNDKSLYIVMTSDLGLCGGFNSNLYLALENQLEENGKDSPLIVCGQKGRDYARRRNFNTIAEYVEIPDIANLAETKEILFKALKMYENDEIGSIKLIYYKYESQLSKKIKVETLLPLSFEGMDEKDSNVEICSEIDIEILIENYLYQFLLNCMLSNKISEHSYRIESTNNAGKNGNDLLNKLNQKYNRARQSSITNEICEIIGGAEALK